MVSYHNFVVRTSKRISAAIEKSEPEQMSAHAGEALKIFRERIVEEVDQIIWTKEATEYREGPDGSYKKAGSLEKDAMVRRTGLTYNEWSRVEIDDKEYYILSDMLTLETPLSAIIYPGQKGEYQKYALSLFPDYGWSSSELEPLINLWERESHWNPSAHNKRTGAHGIPQALPASKMSSAGSDYYTNGNTQVRWGLGYIKSRYGSPSNAWAKFRSRGWY